MRRFFTVTEGPGRGTEKPLDKSYMLVGRSHVADVQIEGEDLLISRRHLELRIKDGAVFVKDISSKGSMLNGQRLKGEVSLNAGDVLELGNTKLQYQELDGTEEDADRTQSRPVPVAEDDRTKLPDDKTKLAADGRTRVAPVAGKENGAADATHAVAEDHTRMLGPQELPGWKSPARQSPSGSAGFWAVAVVIVLVTGASMYWFLSDGHGAKKESIEYKDATFGYSVTFPPEWSRASAKTDPVSFVTGSPGTAEWAQVNIYAEKDRQFSITGMTAGFTDFKDTLKMQFKDAEVIGTRRRPVNDVDVVHFGFRGSDREGVAIYTLNGDTRFVIECFCPRKIQDRYAEAFGNILLSFRLTGGEPQQYIDFPLPDASMKRLALASPAEQARQTQDYARQAEGLFMSKDVRPDNLFRSVKMYQQALQLASAGPKRLSSYPALAQGLRQVRQAYNQSVQRQRFEINRALKAKDQHAAYWEATRLLQMVPDKSEPAYQEAYKIFRSLEEEVK